jgi:thioredoxin 1
MGALKADDQNFETQVLKADGVTIVDFWAEWCGPCKALAPIVDEVAGELPSVRFVKVNIDEAPNTPGKYGIRGIPTLIAFKGGQVIGTRVGGMTKAQLTDWVGTISG